MPKQIHKIDQFHGGLNSNADPRDIAGDELSEAQDVVVDEIGIIRNMGGKGSSIETKGSSSVKTGFGLFPFKTDRNSAGSLSEGVWYAMYNLDDQKVDLLDGAGSSDKNDVMSLGSSSTPVYYFADGGLRGCDGNFSTTNTPKKFGYTDSNLYHTTKEATSGDHDSDGNSQPGTPFHAISRWSSTDMALKSLDDLSITVVLKDAVVANPSSTQIGASTGQLVISYWATENGDWNGVYELGICCKYGDQEGPIYIHDEQIGLIEEMLNMQIYITTGGSTRSQASAHLLGDDRIDGLTIYFRSYGEEEWRMLQEVDLKSGGIHNWQVYDTDKTAHGIFTGSVSLNPPDETTELDTFTLAGCAFNNSSSSITHPVDSRITEDYKVTGTGIPNNADITALTDSTHLSISPLTTTQSSGGQVTLTFEPSSDQTGQYAYKQSTTSVVISNTASGFTDRTGFLRMYGFAISPIYARLDSLASQTVDDVVVINPKTGTASLYCELLDESFNRLEKSDSITVIFEDKGYGPPPQEQGPPSD